MFKKYKQLDYQEEPIDFGMDPYAVFSKIFASGTDCFFLESLGEEGLHSRFAYIGFDPVQVISGKNNTLIIDGKKKTVTNPYTMVQDAFRNMTVSDMPKQGFCGGLSGFIGHEATQYFEPAFTPINDSVFPDFCFGLYTDGLIFDRLSDRSSYFHLNGNRTKKLFSLLEHNKEHNAFSYRFIKANKSKKEHSVMVRKAKEEIAKGNVFQMVLSIQFCYEVFGDPLALYQALRTINPSPNMFFYKFGDTIVMGASPELLVRVDDRNITHMGTLAGTIARGSNDAEDLTLAQKLLGDPKEKAEHMMLVDLARNDVGKLAVFGSVHTKNIMAVKKFSHVQHLSSEIYATLRESYDSFDVLAACFPAGTLTGAPKVEAMKLIAKLEKAPRGPYGGVAGYFSVNGNAMFCLVIRSIAIAGSRAFVQVGSGIVYDSDADKEYQEIMHKGRAMEEALKRAIRDKR